MQTLHREASTHTDSQVSLESLKKRKKSHPSDRPNQKESIANGEEVLKPMKRKEEKQTNKQINKQTHIQK